MVRHSDIGKWGCIVLAAVIGSAAEDLITPTAIAFVCSEMESQLRYAVNTINGSGMSEVPATVNASHSMTATDMWITASATEVTGAIAFDLGSNQEITKTHVWNYNEISTEDKTGRGAKRVDIYYSSDSEYSSASFTKIGTFEFSQGGTTCQTVETPAEDVRIVKFDILENWGYSPGFLGLSEVRFSGAEVAARPRLSRAGAAQPLNLRPVVKASGDAFVISSTAAGTASFMEIYDSRGACVRKLDCAANPAAGANLGKGFYVLRIVP